MSIRPLYDRVVVRRMEEETTTAGGIVLPGSATEKPMEGEVVAVGNGRYMNSGDLAALQVKVGDKVMFEQFGGTEVKVDGETLLIMREEHIMGVIG